MFTDQDRLCHKYVELLRKRICGTAVDLPVLMHACSSDFVSLLFQSMNERNDTSS